MSDDAEFVELSETTQHLFADYMQARESAAAWEQARAELRDELIDSLGIGKRVLMNGQHIFTITKPNADAVRFDRVMFRKAYPDLYHQFEVPAAPTTPQIRLVGEKS